MPEESTTHRRAETSEDLKPISEAMRKVTEKILSRPTPRPAYDPEEQAKHEANWRKHNRWNELIYRIGSRYYSCRLSNLEPMGDSAARARHAEAMEKLEQLAGHMHEHIQAGGNVILYGPPGTGKDHLLVALLRFAIGCDFSVEWSNGQDLYGAFRDRIDTEQSEESAIIRLAKADVLAISDPVPPKGSASEFSTTMLYRVIDKRYRELRSTWITANVAKASEARAELSGPIFDRLIDNCVSVFCNWPSYRHTRKPEWLK